MTSLGVQPPDLKVGGPEIPVNLGEAFSRGANGVSAPGQVSFDGRPQPTDAVTGSANVVAPERIDAAVAKIANFVQGLAVGCCTMFAVLQLHKSIMRRTQITACLNS